MNLLSEIAALPQLRKAWRRILKKNKQTCGFDEQTLSDFSLNLTSNLKIISSELIGNKYSFNKVISRDIPKKKGSTETREIGLYTIKDKVVLKSLQLSFEKRRKIKGTYLFPDIFNNTSIGFVTKDYKEPTGLKRFTSEIAKLYKKGYHHGCSLDIKDFFDHIDRDKLSQILEKALKKDTSIKYIIDQCLDPVVIKLDNSRNEISVTSNTGVTQGSILSPLLSNIYLMNFDKSLEDDTIVAFRFADDVLILSKSKRKLREDVEKVKVLLKEKSCLEFYPSGVKKGPKFFSLPEEVGEYLGLNIVVRPGGTLYLIPGLKSRENQIEKIVQTLSHENLISVSQKITKTNRSIQGWYNYYRIGCNCPKKEMSKLIDYLKNEYELRINHLLRRHQIIPKHLDSEKLAILGVMSPRINFSR